MIGPSQETKHSIEQLQQALGSRSRPSSLKSQSRNSFVSASLAVSLCSIFLSWIIARDLHAEAHAATLLVGCVALHLLADFDVDVKELGHTTIQTHGLALVQITFAVVARDTLLGAGLG